MNNSIIIRLPVLQKAVNIDTKAPTTMPALQFSLLVNNSPKKSNSTDQLSENELAPEKDNLSVRQIQRGELSALLPPPLPMWLKPLEPPQFRCEECGDTFLYEINLKRHMKRRSIRIKFPCAVCKSSLTYFNRCTLLAHVRQHGAHSGEVDLEKVVVTPLDRDSLLLDQETAETPNGETQVAGKRSGFRCFECFEFLDSASARQEHFCPLRPGAHSCNKCPVVCPSKCSLEAHQRIHQMIHPFVCPECGKDESDWDDFQCHLDRICFHRARTLGYKCMLCDELEVSASVQPHKHMLATHSEAYYKCQACPMAFKGPTSFNSHKKLAHPNSGEVPCKTIFKCPLCDTVFHSRDQLIAHLNVHMKDEKVQIQPIFCCPQCSARYRTQSLLKQHFQEEHHHLVAAAPTTTSEETTFEDCVETTRTRRNKLISESPAENHLSSKPPPIKIRIPLQLVRQHSEEASRGIATDSRSLSPTPFRTYTMPTKKLRLHDGSRPEYICAKCDFQTPKQKEFHNHIQFHRKHASSLQCPECGTCFVVENTLRKHLKVAHRVDDIDSYLQRSGFGHNGQKAEEVKTSNNNSRQCTICYQNFQTDSSLKSHMRSHGMAFIRSRTTIAS